MNHNGLPSKTNKYIFNGDFVDRGFQGVEVRALSRRPLVVQPYVGLRTVPASRVPLTQHAFLVCRGGHRSRRILAVLLLPLYCCHAHMLVHASLCAPCMCSSRSWLKRLSPRLRRLVCFLERIASPPCYSKGVRSVQVQPAPFRSILSCNPYLPLGRSRKTSRIFQAMYSVQLARKLLVASFRRVFSI